MTFRVRAVACCLAAASGLGAAGACKTPGASSDAQASGRATTATATPPPAGPSAPAATAASATPRALDPRVYEDGGKAGTPPEEPAPTTYAVAAIGDSLTDPRSGGGKYLKYLKTKCPESTFDSYGVGGEMVNQMRRRFARDVLGTPPTPGKPDYTHVIVFGGVNDLYSDLTAGRTPEKIGKDLGTMYQISRDHGMKVVAITVAPWGGFSRYYNAKRGAATKVLNDWIESQLEGGAIDFVVDAYPLLSCGNPEKLCDRYMKPYRDGLHLGPEGHEKLGEALYREVFADCR